MTIEVDAQVANILDGYQVTLTAGSARGVVEGNLVTIWRTVEVIDPGSGERLGQVRVDNLKLRVREVYEKFSLAAVPRETANFFPSLGLTLPRKKIAIGGPDGEGDDVRVQEGDAATIYVEAAAEGSDTDG